MVIVVSALTVLLGGAQAAWAHKNGIEAMGCDSCHQGGRTPTVTLSAMPTQPAVGEAVTLTISVSQTNGNIAGFYLTNAFGGGTYKAIESGTTATTDGVIHTMPRTGSGGKTTFQAQWTTNQMTGVEFDVFALSANGNNATSGDGAGTATLSVVVGCGAGHTYYLDQDGDGYGTNDPNFPPRQDCSLPQGYAVMSGDCDDYHSVVHPGAPELCDGKDNDCNGAVDDAVVTRLYCEDKDGDGHGVVGRTTKMDCAPSAGFGDCNGDCDDLDKDIWPGAVEVCNGIDDNCDGTIDEGVRATCGTGACKRTAATCTGSCVPGAPGVEVCNGLDDDCDGITDNGTDAGLCGASGMACMSGRCVAGDGGAGSGGTSGADAGRDAGSDAGNDGGSDAATDGARDAGASSGSGGASTGSGGASGGSHGAAGGSGCAIAAAARAPRPVHAGWFVASAVALWFATRRRRRG